MHHKSSPVEGIQLSARPKNRMPETVINRCRIVLAVPPNDAAPGQLAGAFAAGDVASAIALRGDMDGPRYQAHLEALVAAGSGHDAAILAVDDSQAMGRTAADGMLTGGDPKALKDIVARFSPKRIIGYGPVKSRHQAMEAAEAEPNFLFVGRLDGDIRPDPHPKNLGLGEWCAEVMQLPVLVMAGSALESALDVARTGVDFAVLGLAVFSHTGGAAEAVRRINAALDEHAPRFEDEE